MTKEQLLAKLRLDPTQAVLIVNAPKEYISLLGSMKYDTKPLKADEGKYDFVQLFATTQTQLEKLTQQCFRAGKHNCVFWATYPKGGGHIKSDIRRETVWNAFDKVGLRPVGQLVIDETWGALRGRPPEAAGATEVAAAE